MANKTQAENKFGPQNYDVALSDDGILTIRVDTKGVSHNPDGSECLRGTPNASGQARKMNLIGTSGGFKGIGSVQVSLNVTS